MFIQISLGENAWKFHSARENDAEILAEEDELFINIGRWIITIARRAAWLL